MLVAKLIALHMMARSRSNTGWRARRANAERQRMSNRTDHERGDQREERLKVLRAEAKRRRRAAISSQQRQTEIDQSFSNSIAEKSEPESTMSPEPHHSEQNEPEQETLIQLAHQPTSPVNSEPIDESEQRDPLTEHFGFENELQELKKENVILKNAINILKHKQKALQSDLARVTAERDNLRNVLTFDIKHEETI